MVNTFATNWSRQVGDRLIEVRCSTRADGDFHLDQLHDVAASPAFVARRRAFVDLPWTMVDEEHGIKVAEVKAPGECDGDVADSIVTSCFDTVLGSWAGDCAPIVLVGETSRIGVVHAGWRGLASGAIDAAAVALGEPVAVALLGPCIWSCCYEFGVDDIDLVARGVHADPAAITTPFVRDGRPDSVALDVPAAVRRAVESLGAEFVVLGACTGCSYDGFSHRVRADRERHVVAVWQHAGDGATDGALNTPVELVS